MEKIIILEPGSYLSVEYGKKVRGGSISTHSIIEALKSKYEVHLITSSSLVEVGVFNYNGITIHNLEPVSFFKSGLLYLIQMRVKFGKYLSELIEKDNFSIAMSQANLISPTINVTKNTSTKSIMWVRAFENFYDGKINHQDTALKKLNFFLKKVFFKKMDLESLQNSDCIITNSIFMKRFIYEEIGMNSEVVYPPIDINNVSTRAPNISGNKVVIMNPTIDKGLDIVLKIAKRKQDIDFIYFGAKPSNADCIMREHKNVFFKGWETNKDVIFNNARVLLVPSKWPEPFGRVSIEGCMYGCVPLVANSGGLPETVNFDSHLVVRNIANIDEWVDKLTLLMNDEIRYLKAYWDMNKHIQSYNINSQSEKLENIIGTLLK